MSCTDLNRKKLEPFIKNSLNCINRLTKDSIDNFIHRVYPSVKHISGDRRIFFYVHAYIYLCRILSRNFLDKAFSCTALSNFSLSREKNCSHDINSEI